MNIVNVSEDIWGAFSENGEADTDGCGMIAFIEEDDKLIVLQHSRYICVMLGLAEEKCNTEELEGENILSVIPWFARERLLEELHAMKVTQDPGTVVVSYVKSNGKIMDVIARVTVTMSENGDRMYMAICEDVAKKKSATLRTSTEQLIAVFRYVYDEIGVLNFEKDFYANVSANPETLPVGKMHGRLSDMIGYLKENIWTGEEIKLWQFAFERVKNKTLDSELPGSPVNTHFYNYKYNKIIPYKVRMVPVEGSICLLLARKVVGKDDEKAIKENEDSDEFAQNRDGEALVIPPRTNIITVRTFGYFDLFIGGQAVSFSSAKAKELLAVLVDRRGGYVSSKEAISMLWEDEPADALTLSRYRKVALRLKQTLQENGIEELVTVKNGNRKLNVDMVRCDLYDYLSGQPEFENMFNGYYMNNYSWGENTLATLENLLNR